MGLYISASGMLTAQERQRITANNVASLRTPGYRAQNAQTQQTAGGGVSLDAIRTNSAPGPLEYTGAPLDFTAGDGFFQVQRSDGTLAYTQDGRFSLNADGEVVTADGSRLMPPIQVPAGAGSISVTASGQVYAAMPDSMELRPAGQMEVFSFNNPGGLESLGGNLYRATGASGPAQSMTANIMNGMLEGSNVDLTRESINQVLDLQAFRANLNAFRAQDETIGSLLDLQQ